MFEELNKKEAKLVEEVLNGILPKYESWIESTGAFTKFDSYYYEVKAFIIESVELSIKKALN